MCAVRVDAAGQSCTPGLLFACLACVSSREWGGLLHVRSVCVRVHACLPQLTRAPLCGLGHCCHACAQ